MGISKNLFFMTSSPPSPRRRRSANGVFRDALMIANFVLEPFYLPNYFFIEAPGYNPEKIAAFDSKTAFKLCRFQRICRQKVNIVPKDNHL
jgi:hypothetical protein